MSGASTDFLDAVGRAILTADTRWLILGLVLVMGLFSLLLRWRKQRVLSRDDATSFVLVLLQLYSAATLFSMLVLTQPPATELVSTFERQSAGLLASVFLAASVLLQIRRYWSG